MKSNFIITIIISILLVAFACKKVTDDIDPQIIIDFPPENSVINIPDTVYIQAVVSDDNKLESIQIVITDENFIPVFGSYSYTVSGNPTYIEDELIVDDILMQSGIYYLKIRAFDGVNSKNAYRKIYINEMPGELNDLIIITKNTAYLNVQNVDKKFSLNTLFTVDASFIASEISSMQQLLYIAGKYYENLRAYNLVKNEEEWSIEGKNHPPLPYFRNIYFDNELYISTSEGEIRAYNENLVNVVTAVMPDNLIPGFCFIHGDYIISEAFETSGAHTYLVSFFASSGSLSYKLLVDRDVVGLFPKDENKIYVITSVMDEGGILVYDVKTNGLEEIKKIIGEIVITAAPVDDKNLLLALGDGIYHYTYSNNSLTKFVDVNSTFAIRFDKIGKLLFVAETNKICSYTYPQGTLINSVDVPNEIMNMHLHYNK